MDELAIICCFAKFLQLQIDAPWNVVNEPGLRANLRLLVGKLNWMLQNIVYGKRLSGISTTVNKLLDLILGGDVTFEDL